MGMDSGRWHGRPFLRRGWPLSGCAKLLTGKEAPMLCLLNGLLEEVRRQPRCHAVHHLAERRCQGHRALSRLVLGRNVSKVENDVGEQSEAALPPVLKDGEVSLVGEDIGQLMQPERGLVAEDPGAVGP